MEQFVGKELGACVHGVSSVYEHYPISFANNTLENDNAALLGPLQFDEIEIGEESPVRCVTNCMWFSAENTEPFAVLVVQSEMFCGSPHVRVEFAVLADDNGHGLQDRFFSQMERYLAEAGSYRGKIISLEAEADYAGTAGGIKVHRLPGISRDEVVLPEKTLKLLERNVSGFVKQRVALRKIGMPTKKGLLFYGPPGTGKTHTIRYLAASLKNHTTLLITSEQVGLLAEYFQLSRFMQPSIMVIEDVDLIARSREMQDGPCSESLLNRLLNEMDGLRQDSEVLFVLTTNRPDQLEEALASRPGRVDQAIEFPLPDATGRRKLVKLYAGGMDIGAESLERIVDRTDQASAAFIKELMRRSAQYHIESENAGELKDEHVDAAIQEMLFSGGSLNRKLLGGATDVCGFHQATTD